MTFSSLTFIFRFFPVLLIVYSIVRPNIRSIVLLIFSLAFYAYNEPDYISLLTLSLFLNYIFSKFIVASKRPAFKKIWLTIAIIINFGALLWFKYAGFFFEGIRLPLGISFFTFQIVSFVIDAYRGEIKDLSFNGFSAFATMFPTITSGPITRYSQIEKNIFKLRFSPAKLEKGISLFIIGLSSKILLADKIEALWAEVWRIGPHGLDILSAWLGAWGYSFQLYFDFCGYSLMAIGIGLMLGLTLPKNFDNPYWTKSMTDFWRHWHITLGQWFRDYLYIPLGGNRKGKLRTVINIFIVWSLTAIWHGNSLNFALWGIFLFLVIFIEKLFLGKFMENSRIIGHIYMMLLIPLNWIIFKIEDLRSLWEYIRRMFGIPLEGMVINKIDLFIMLIYTYWWILALCVLFATPLPSWLYKNLKNNFLMKISLIFIFIFDIYQLTVNGSNPFLYFKF